MRAHLSLLVVIAGCGAAASKTPPLGVQGHLAEAERCEKDATRHEEHAEQVELANQNRQPACGDSVLADQTTSGGKRIASAPCWTSARDRERDAAMRLRADARSHREMAARLAKAETTSCATMPADELDHTPFAHRDDIVSVAAELDGDHVRGARIRFRKVAGLTADWLRTAITCHQARAAALGYDATYMGYDPSVLAGAEAKVIDDPDGVIVVVTAGDDAIALAAYGRAEDLMRGRW